MDKEVKKIVICGSIKFKKEMYELKSELEELNYEVLMPTGSEYVTEKKKKREYNLIHFKKIDDESTDAIIVLNKEKNGVPNYIGANSFSEIALAFYFDKKVFLLNDIYEPYADELETWECIPLKGNLNKIKN